jgi:hypothetical protein
MEGGLINPLPASEIRVTHRLSWTSPTSVFRPAEPVQERCEVCGVVDARASLRRVRRGRRGQVRLWVKPMALEAAINAASQFR